jgi:hypothetical protein
MGQKKKNKAAHSPEEARSEKKKIVLSAEKRNVEKHDEGSLEKPHLKNDEKIKPGGFMNDVEETANLIDPRNEHHHNTGDTDG